MREKLREQKSVLSEPLQLSLVGELNKKNLKGDDLPFGCKASDSTMCR
jgi:hypothetical protein